MKTSNYSRAWECEHFTMEFNEFLDTENMVIKLQSYTSFMSSPSSSNLYKSPHTNMIYNSFQNGIQIHEN